MNGVYVHTCLQEGRERLTNARYDFGLSFFCHARFSKIFYFTHVTEMDSKFVVLLCFSVFHGIHLFFFCLFSNNMRSLGRYSSLSD
jgi:hypothetical protein